MQSLNRPIRTALLVMVVLGFVGIASFTGNTKSREARHRDSIPNAVAQNESTPIHREIKPDLSAILFLNSKSCPCTREQCRIAEGVMEKIQKEYAGDVAFERVDYELQYEKAKPLLDKYDVFAFMIPVLVVLDGKHSVVWRCTDFSEPELIDTRFKELVSTPNVSPRELPAETGLASRPE